MLQKARDYHSGSDPGKGVVLVPSQAREKKRSSVNKTGKSSNISRLQLSLRWWLNLGQDLISLFFLFCQLVDGHMRTSPNRDR